MLEINHLDFFLTKYYSYISSVWSNCINRVRAVQCVILNIKSENQALFYRECAIFPSIILNWLSDNNHA